MVSNSRQFPADAMLHFLLFCALASGVSEELSEDAKPRLRHITTPALRFLESRHLYLAVGAHIAATPA